MKAKTKKILCVTGILLLIYVVFTILVATLDVQVVGPNDSRVGFASLNTAFRQMTGDHPSLYTISDILELIPFACVACFGVIGLVQLIKRKSIKKVDADILALGGFYILVGICFVLFEIMIINYRPVLINGILEASYPSSTTLLVLTVMPTAMIASWKRIPNDTLRTVLLLTMVAYTTFMVVARTLSGVHWLTDIIGGIILASVVDTLYLAALSLIEDRELLKEKV